MYSNIKFLINLVLWLLVLWRGTTKEKLYSKWMKRAIFVYMSVYNIVDLLGLVAEYKKL